jgi:hypothetical protein
MAQTAAKPLHADRVVVQKKERTLQLLSGGRVIKSYRVALGGDPVGAKTRQGDHKTPEGIYVLDSRNAHSQFHKSIHISYPNARDRAEARARGGVLLEVMYLCMDCRMDMGGLERHIGRRIGRMDVLPSLMRRLRRFGRRWGMGRRLRFGRDFSIGEDAAWLRLRGTDESVRRQTSRYVRRHTRTGLRSCV